MKPFVLSGIFVLVALTSFGQSGSLDGSFGSSGLVTSSVTIYNNDASGVVVQPDGKIVIAGTAVVYGWTSDFSAVRYNSDGTIDSSFANSGIMKLSVAGTGSQNDVRGLALQKDGKILISGTSQSSTTGS